MVVLYNLPGLVGKCKNESREYKQKLSHDTKRSFQELELLIVLILVISSIDQLEYVKPVSSLELTTKAINKLI